MVSVSRQLTVKISIQVIIAYIIPLQLSISLSSVPYLYRVIIPSLSLILLYSDLSIYHHPQDLI